MGTRLLTRKLIIVTGKGGTGKSTVAAALGILGAQQGLRTLVVELGGQQRVPELLGHSRTSQTGVEHQLEPGLWNVSLDPDQALVEWLREVGGRITGRMIANSSSFQYFAAAAPGAKELVSMVKLRELIEPSGRADASRAGATRRASSALQSANAEADEHQPTRGRYDRLVLDAPATGHALAMLRAPQTFSAIIRGGPLAAQAQAVGELLADEQRTALVAVAQGSEMAVSETLELESGLRDLLARDLDAVIVNRVLPRRFTRAELELLGPIGGAAADAAAAMHQRASTQRVQLARLRRKHQTTEPSPVVTTVPFLFTSGLDRDAIMRIARRLRPIT